MNVSPKLWHVLFALVVMSMNASGAPYVVTVTKAEGEKIIDADFVSALGTSEALVKKGDGVLRSSSALANYAGEIRIEAGVFAVPENGSLGTSAGATYVSEGATLLFDCQTQNGLTDKNETIYFAGDGAEDYAGAIVNNGAMQQYGVFGEYTAGGLVMTDDATISRTENGKRFDVCNSSLTMNGHTLTIDMTSRDYRFSLVRSRVVEPGHIVVKAGAFTIEGNAKADWAGTESNTITVKAGAGLYRLESNAVIPWEVIAEDGSYVRTIKEAFVGNSAYHRFDGPFAASGWVFLNSIVGAELRLAGPVSGSGTLYEEAGWLHLLGMGGTYSGQVFFNGAISRPGGLVIGSNGALPMESDVRVAWGDVRVTAAEDVDLPPISIENTGNIVGGHGTLASLKKTGAGVCDISGVYNISGRTEIVAGTVRIAKMPTGRAGLKKSEVTAAESGCDIWTMVNIVGGYTFPEQGKTALSFDKLAKTGASYWRKNEAVQYTGYVWNRSDHDVAWTFYSHINAVAKLKIDNMSTLEQFESTGYKIWGPITLTPGFHKVTMRAACQNEAVGGAISDEGFPPGFGYDTEGRTEFVGANFKPMVDPGDGSLFTLDTATSADLDPAVYRTTFADITLTDGAVLDLNDREHAAVVGNISGSGIVSNGTLRITGAWKPRPGELLKIENGDLIIDDSAVIDFGNIKKFSHAREGVVIGKVDGTISGLERFATPAKNWELSVEDNGEILLKNTAGLILLFK